MIRSRTASTFLAVLAGAAAAQAQVPPSLQVVAPPQNVVSLSASASVDVKKDVLGIVFSTTRDGADAASVQSQLSQALDGALAEARKAARPGEIEVRTGNFSLYPRYAPKGGISGWQGSTELVVEGRDIDGISRLAGRIPGLTIARVAFSLSREARAKVENEVTAQAIEQFRAKAEFVSRQFGFGGYSIREISVGSNDSAPMMVPQVRMTAMAAGDSALPVEAGKATVTASVNGSVQMSPGR